MILHRLLWRFLWHRDDAEFYRLQATDAVRWLKASGVALGPGVSVLDLGCGHGVFGRALLALGCRVTFADEHNQLLPECRLARFEAINLDRDKLDGLGRFDLVVCSNVLEHLRHPETFLSQAHVLLNPSGRFFLSWTNWLSPWGGHEFSPLHYLGSGFGPWLFGKMGKRHFHRPGINLFPTFVGRIMAHVARSTRLRIIRCAPRYYTELEWLMAVPGLREFLAWNCAMILEIRPVVDEGTRR